MTGVGGMTCTAFYTTADILKRWPFLEYLPRPEPPREYTKAHGQWKKEYAQWKGLKCSRQKGAYFCRRHGKWITCVELQAGLARPQQEERDETHECPSSHYEWEQMEEGFHQRQSAHLENLAQRLKEAETNAQPSIDPSTGQELESQFDRLNIGSSSGGKQHDYYGRDTDNYYQTKPSYAEASNYSRQSDYSEEPSHHRDKKYSSGRSGSKYSGKSHKSQGSRSHISRDSQSSKSTWTTHSTTASSPPSESYSPYPVPTYGEHQAVDAEYSTAPYYGSNPEDYTGEDDNTASQPYYR
ncbi:hypothetical protein V8F20_006948 [Naviculisporaceae sp. PSN 640]